MKTITIVSLGIATATFGLSSLGFSEAPKAVENAPKSETAVSATASAVSITATATAVSLGVASINEKLNRIIIPRIDFEGTTLEEAINFLRLQAKELDVAEKDPARKGINIVIRRPRPANKKADGAAAEAADPGALIVKELHVSNVPLAIALKYICDQTQMAYKVDDFAVTIVPLNKAD